nr:S41 family peptidase [uncultured Brevundimonas sp.]
MDRRLLLRAGLAATVGSTLSGAAWAAEPDHDVTFLNDFDELWETLRDRYCFFSEKRTDWNRVRDLYRPLARSADTDDAFAEVLRRTLAELYDAHTSLANPPAGSQRLPISDLIVEPRDGQAVIVALAPGSVAAETGLALGDVILSSDGRPVAPLVKDLLPRCLTRPDPAAEAYALNSAVAGRRGQPRRYQVATGGSEPRDVFLPVRQSPPKPNVEWRRLDDGAGYVAIRSFADDAVTASFDQALAALQDAPGLIIDVRDNGGGDTAVARPIMGRFITQTKPYARMRRRQGRGLGEFWTETVEPRGPFTYTRPVVVLTNHWSGSMAEGFPMGMRGLGRATVVGTPMMGLGAAVFPITLDRTGLKAQYSAEPVYDVNDRPRWLMQPDIAVLDGQDILTAGRRVLAAATA